MEVNLTIRLLNDNMIYGMLCQAASYILIFEKIYTVIMSALRKKNVGYKISV